MDSNISIQSQRHMKEKMLLMNRKTEKSKEKAQKQNGNSKSCGNDNNKLIKENEEEVVESISDVDDDDDDPTTIKHNTITSLSALKQMLNAYADATSTTSSAANQSFFQNYFQNHTNSLPSRSVINCRRLSQCREEDEDEDNKKEPHVPSSDISTISGSDRSLSETSSTDSKTSVIDTITGPTHKFVVTKTKQPSETVTKNFAKSSKKYQQANTVNFPTEANKSRPSVYSLFGKSSLNSPHYDTRFFDSTLIEMKSENSSSSTIDYGSTDDIWVKRVPDNKKELGSQPLPTLSSDESEQQQQQDAPRQRAGTWGAKTERQKHEKDKSTKTKENKLTKQQLQQQQNDKKDKRSKDKNRGGSNGAESSRSSSLERRKSDEMQSPKKPGMLDAIRNRSSSDASKKKASAFMASMRSAMLHTGLMHNSRPKAPKDGSAHPVKDSGSHTQYYHTIGSGYSSSSRSTMTKVMDIFRNRHVTTDEKSKKRAAQQSQAPSTYLRRTLDPERRRQSLGTIIPHRASDTFLDPNHAAILFRDSRGLPAVDPFLERINASDQEIDDSKIFIKFFKFHKCYDLIPTSAKLVVFDMQLLVKKAFFALVYNGVRAAPLWDSNKQQFVGMLTITDFIKILRMYYKSPNVDIEELEEHKLDTWREVLNDERPFISIGPDASLFDAIKTLIENRIHRLPVIESDTGNVLYILTHKRILRFLFLYINELPKPSYMNKTIRELNLGTYENIETAQEDMQIITALTKFEDRRVSALPIVDGEGHLIDIYAKFDVINLAAEKTYNDLNVPIKKANEHRNEWFEGVHKCKLDETLLVVLDRIVKAEIHRLVVVDDDNKVIGIVSLSDLLQYLVLRPVGEDDEDDEEAALIDIQNENETVSQISNPSDEVTETIAEEDEQDPLANEILDNNTGIFTNNRIIDSPVLDKASLSNDKPLFREVTVSGGE